MRYRVMYDVWTDVGYQSRIWSASGSFVEATKTCKEQADISRLEEMSNMRWYVFDAIIQTTVYKA